MPELPEVETIRRSLQGVAGRCIESIYFSALAPVETTTPKKIRVALLHQMMTAIDRHGKYLLFRTKSGAALVVHLGMTGRLHFLQQPTPRPQHTHLELIFTDHSRLQFIDARRFSTISITQDPAYRDNPFLKRLGPDFINGLVTPEAFVSRCRQHPGLTLKSLTLHQGVMAGLGNIYACESLYRAGLNPRRRVKRTSSEELKCLLAAARDILTTGIRQGGTTLRDYLDGLGNRGTMKKYLQVYGRDGMKTLDGRGLVKRIVQGQRATFYAPEVQK